MKSTKLLSIITVTLVFSTLLFIYRDSSFTPAKKNRALFTRADQSSQCSSIDLGSIFGASYVNYINNVTANYTASTINNLTGIQSNSDLTSIIVSAMSKNSTNKTNTSANLENYVKNKLVAPIVFIIFAILSFLGIWSYFTCCCCPCCCCSNKVPGGNICRFVSIAIALTFSAGIIITSAIGISFGVNFLNGFSAMSCSFLNFYYDVTLGVNTNSTPRWIGVSGIQNSLNNTIASLNQIAQNSDSAFTNTGYLRTDPNNFMQSLNRYYSTYGSMSLSNPNPAPSTRNGKSVITPIYIKTYGDSSSAGTAQYAIWSEYNARIQASANTITGLQSNINTLKVTINSITSSLTNVNTQLGSLNDQIKKFGDSIIDPIINAQSNIKGVGLTIVYAIFGAFIGIACLNVLGIILFGIFKIQILRLLNHFAWVLAAIFMIILFLLGGLFLIVGILGSDAGGALTYLFSTTGLKTTNFFPDSTTVNMLDICLNGNGQLMTYFNLDTGSTSILDSIYQAQNNLTSLQKNITQNLYSVSIQSLNTQYYTYQGDLSQSTDTDNSNSAAGALNSFSQFSDSNANSFMSKCSNPAKDSFVANSTFCKPGYTYASSSANPALGNQNCLLFSDWSSSSISSRYAGYSGCSGNTDFPTVSAGDLAYFNSLSSYVSANNQLLNNLIAANADLNNQMVTTMNNLITTINNVNNLLAPFSTIFSSIVGTSSIFNLVNCGFLALDVGNIIKAFTNGFSGPASQLGAILGVTAFFSMFLVVFTIFMINFTLDPAGSQPNPADMQSMQSQTVNFNPK